MALTHLSCMVLSPNTLKTKLSLFTPVMCYRRPEADIEEGRCSKP